MSQCEMQECHVDLEQAGPPDNDETSGMHNINLLVVALVEEMLIVITVLISAVVCLLLEKQRSAIIL